VQAGSAQLFEIHGAPDELAAPLLLEALLLAPPPVPCPLDELELAAVEVLDTPDALDEEPPPSPPVPALLLDALDALDAAGEPDEDDAEPPAPIVRSTAVHPVHDDAASVPATTTIIQAKPARTPKDRTDRLRGRASVDLAPGRAHSARDLQPAAPRFSRWSP
jgi:hypothetical protein